jgi:hypothetical protein
MNSAELQLAASEWDNRQLTRLHAVLYNGLPVNWLYLAAYYLFEDDEGIWLWSLLSSSRLFGSCSLSNCTL